MPSPPEHAEKFDALAATVERNAALLSLIERAAREIKRAPVTWEGKDDLVRALRAALPEDRQKALR